MPPMTWLGWFHTILGAIAILTAAYTLYHHRIIRAADAPGRAYLLMTLLVAGSALAIYNQGGFGVGHWLAVLTLTALIAVGDPFVDSLDAPLVRGFHLAFLAAFVLGVLAQWLWLARGRR